MFAALAGGCGLSVDGRAFCWDYEADSIGGLPRLEAIAQPSGVRFERIAGNCGLQATGQVHCWGGQVPGYEHLTQSLPIPRPGGTLRLRQWDGACGVTAGGRILCTDLHVEPVTGPPPLGLGDDFIRPVRSQPEGVRIRQVARGGHELCALSADARLFCVSLQRTIGQPAREFRPIPVPAGVVPARLEPGEQMCARTADARRVCWGNREDRTGRDDAPALVQQEPRFTRVSYGEYHACGVTPEGQVLCWGTGSAGQLGHGSLESSSVPVRVRQPRGVVFRDVAAEGEGTCALASDGALYCWGTTSAQFGDEREGQRTVPRRIPGTGGGHVPAIPAPWLDPIPAAEAFGDAEWAFARGDTAAAVAALRRSAEAGYAPGQNALGEAYEYGRGVPVDPVAAVEWYRRAAEGGDALAQRNLGALYQHGVGVARDDAAAVAWFRRAAAQDLPAAQNDLGYMYLNGLGVPRDAAEAARLFLLAARNRDRAAQLHLGHLYENGIGVPQDRERALVWYRVAAARGSPEAAEAYRRLGGPPIP